MIVEDIIKGLRFSLKAYLCFCPRRRTVLKLHGFNNDSTFYGLPGGAAPVDDPPNINLSTLTRPAPLGSSSKTDMSFSPTKYPDIL